MTFAKIDQNYSKAGFEQFLDRDWRGAPIIWPEGTDPDAVQAWRDSGPTIKERNAKLRPKGGKAYARTTTFVDVIDDKSNLIDWLARKQLIGLTLQPELIERAKAVEAPDSIEGKRVLDRIVRDAKDAADANLKADIGTLLHEVFEEYDGGQDVGFLPDDYAAIFEQYKKHTAHLKPVYIEQFGVNDQYEVAGTLDRIVYDERDDVIRVADVKSGSIIKHGKIARQIALYAHMKGYDPKTFERTPYTFEGKELDTTFGLILHTPSDADEPTCDVYKVRIDLGWKGVDLCSQVRDERNAWNRKDRALELVAGTHFEG